MNVLALPSNINALARSGMVFTEFYACSAVCAPSRVGLLTGRYPFRTGITGNAYPEDEPVEKRAARQFGVLFGGLGVLDIQESYVVRGISDHELTVADALSVARYRTAMVGKWHLGDYSTAPKYNPRNHGFDYYYGVPYSNDMSPFPLYRNFDEVDPDISARARIRRNLPDSTLPRLLISSPPPPTPSGKANSGRDGHCSTISTWTRVNRTT